MLRTIKDFFVLFIMGVYLSPVIYREYPGWFDNVLTCYQIILGFYLVAAIVAWGLFKKLEEGETITVAQRESVKVWNDWIKGDFLTSERKTVLYVRHFLIGAAIMASGLIYGHFVLFTQLILHEVVTMSLIYRSNNYRG